MWAKTLTSPVEKQELFLVSGPSQADTEFRGVVMGCVNSARYRIVKLKE